MDSVIDYNTYCEHIEEYEQETGNNCPRNRYDPEWIKLYELWHTAYLAWLQQNENY
jgi:hypothetical protein